MSTPDQRAAFVERMGAALTSAGLARLPSRIFAAVLVDEDGRMTAAEIGEALGVSPAAVRAAPTRSTASWRTSVMPTVYKIQKCLNTV
jgi:DNA-binding transcriptional regulator GbsR (MarR family)